ncbi:MAG: amidase [Pseudomonadota bacterium]
MIPLADYARHDATALARLLRQGEVSAAELAQAARAAVELLNPRLNAVVGPLAQDGDAACVHDANGPLAGVPFLVKDLVLRARGLPCQMGSRLLAGARAAETDSTLMQRFRAAGFVTLGRTNAAEFGYSATTEPVLHGAVRNPWDTEASAGGSSGGAAAAVAAGIVPVAHANDSAGSIRIPASHCGVVGLKPTRGRVPIGPDIGMAVHDLGISHVICRTVRDCALVLDRVEGPEPGDRFAIARPAVPYAEHLRSAPPRLRIAFHVDAGALAQVDAACVAAVCEAAALCESLGHGVEQAQPAYDASQFHEASWRFCISSLAAGVTAIAAARGRPAAEDELEASVWASVQAGLRLGALELEEADAMMNRVSRAVAPLFARHDVLITPVAVAPPAKLHTLGGNDAGIGARAWYERVMALCPFTSLFNMTGQPAISVPFGWTAEGLPVGVQLVGRFGDEAMLLRLAAQFEEARPWAGRLPPVSARHPGGERR